MGLVDKINGADYDELLEILASDDDGEMTVAELHDITGWEKADIVNKLKKLIRIKAITGRFHVGKQTVFFNSIDTTPYRNQKTVYRQGPLMKSYMGLFMETGKGGKNKKTTTVIQCPKCKATKQVIQGNVVKCDYCDVPMTTKSF